MSFYGQEEGKLGLRTQCKLSMNCNIFGIHINCCFVAEDEVADGHKLSGRSWTRQHDKIRQ